MAEEKKSSHILRHFKRMSKDGWLAAEKPPNKYLKNKMIATVGVAAHVALASNSMDQKLDNAFVGAVDRIVMATDFIMRWHPIRHFIYQICPTDVCWWLSVAPMYTTGWHRYKDGTRPFDECSVTVWCHRTNFAFILLILIWQTVLWLFAVIHNRVTSKFRHDQQTCGLCCCCCCARRLPVSQFM